jgi:3-oxoadipate enol-lactonase
MDVNANGVRFNCEIGGKEGAPWITFSHALANNLTLWDDMVAALEGDFRILRYDHRGHGGSEAVPGPYTFPMIVADAIAIWDALGIEDSHWVGLSIGGMMGYGMAIHHGARIKSLVACDARPDAPPDYAAYFQYRIDTAREKGMAGLVEPSIERWFTPEFRAKNPPILEKLREMIRTTNPVGHEGCCEALKTLGYGPDLHRIAVPTLVLGGAADKGAPPDVLADAAARIPGAEHRVLPGAGHITPMECPDALRAALLGWFGRHG